MTTDIAGNAELADAAARMADAHPPDSTSRKACACAAVALRFTKTPAAARRVLERHEPLDEAVRAAALAVVDQLAAEQPRAPGEGPATP